MKRPIILALAVLATLLATTLGTASADPATDGFATNGTVRSGSPTFDSTGPAGNTGSFVLAGLSGSAGAVQPESDGTLRVNTDPATVFYAQDRDANGNPTGPYKKVTFQEAIRPGRTLRTAGRRVRNAAGQLRYLAQYVWNPPFTPGPPARTPQCGQATGLQNAGFNIVATIVKNKVHVPCTGVGDQAGGFSLNNFTEFQNWVAPGIDAYDGFGIGALDVYVVPGQTCPSPLLNVPCIPGATEYVKGNRVSDWGSVVLPGNQVRVWGRMQKAEGAWMFAAKLVWTPAPGAAASDRIITDVNAGESSPGTYDGASTGPAFPAGTFSADIAWTQVGTDWTLSGNWRLTGTAGDVLSGTLDGHTSGADLQVALDVTGGRGYYAGAVGGGSLTGTIVPSIGVAPSGFRGKVDMEVVRGVK
jgi:hypothetical protein